MSKTPMKYTKPVSVCVRVKPGLGIDDDLDVFPTNTLIRFKNKEYYFDRIFNRGTTNSDVFTESVEPFVKRVIEGYSGTIVLNGSTGSGKTFTLVGDEAEEGIVPMIMKTLLNSKYEIKITYAEVYKEVMFDILRPVREAPSFVHTRVKSIDDFVKQRIENLDQFIKLFDKANAQRRHAAKVNYLRAQKTHAILRIELTDPKSKKAHMFQICDLASPEIVAKGLTEKRREYVAVNKSIYTLRAIIRLLAIVSTQRIAYQDSRLTKLLEPSLSRFSLVLVMSHIDHIATIDTEHSLEFVSRAHKMYVEATEREIVRNDYVDVQDEEKKPSPMPEFKQKVLERALQMEKQKVQKLQHRISQFEHIHPSYEDMVDLSLEDDFSIGHNSCKKKKNIFSYTAKMLGF